MDLGPTGDRALRMGLGGTYVRMYVLTDGQIPPRVLQDFVPFGAAAQKMRIVLYNSSHPSVETLRRPRCSFLSYYYAYGAAADFMTVKRQLLVRSVCVWEEGMAVSQSGFWVSEEIRSSTNSSLFLSFLVPLYLA